MTRYALDPDGPTELVAKDGLTIPWRPILSRGGDPIYRGIEIAPERLADWPGGQTGGPPSSALWWPCADCDNGIFWGPDDERWECVACRGTGQRPFAFVGIDFTYGVIPSD